jgi:hypothetical protein
VPASLASYVQAVTSAGGPMRDTFMLGGAVMSDSSTSGVMSTDSFYPGASVTRTDLAKWLVRALGRDAPILRRSKAIQ